MLGRNSGSISALKVGATDLGERIRLLAAIAFFQEKQLSLGKAAELAGLNRLTFMDLLTQRGIVVFDYDESALVADLACVTALVSCDSDHQQCHITCGKRVGITSPILISVKF